MADTNPIGRLNEYATKNGTRVYDEYTHSGPDHSRKFICVMSMNDKVSRGEGKTKKDAKVKAALNMLDMLPSDDLPPIRAKVSPSPFADSTDGMEVSPEVVVVNAKGSLQELCQKNQLGIPTYKTISKKGPAHELSFTVTCTVTDLNGDVIERVYGNGKSKKIAEAEAANEMKQKIDKLLPNIINGVCPISKKMVPRSGHAKPIPLEDQVQLDELFAQVLAKDFNTPEFQVKTSEPADPNDLSTMKYLCLVLAYHSNPSRVECRYDVKTLPVTAHAIGNTEEEARREALLNLLNNISLLGL